MDKNRNPFFSHLRCRECGRSYPKQAIHICEFDFGPLEAAYDYDAIGRSLTREQITRRPQTMWRYRELLPIDAEPTVGTQVGFTPLVRADRLARRLGLRELYIKNDTVNYPTLSFKDRVVSVALSRRRELGFEVVACASTGNLANSVAANAAAAGLKSYVLIPADLESGKVLGSLVYGTSVIGIHGAYDQVNRLCSEIAGKYGWGFVNVNLRPYYAEGSKTMGFEIAEQLGWRAPRHTVVPMASGSLLTKIHKAYKEFTQLGLIEHTHFSVHGAQATGCSPITEGMKKGSDLVKPVAKPQTIAKSLAIGTPADGYYAIHTMRDTGGWAEDATDDEIIEGIKLLAECEGIFAETAGGVTVACAKKLVETGKIGPNESTVLCITGHGLKTAEAVTGQCGAPRLIKPSLREFDELIGAEQAAVAHMAATVLKPRYIPIRIMPTNIRIPTPLRKLTSEQEVVQAEGSTIDEIFQSLEASFPGLKERICDESGNVRRFVNVYLNDEDIRFLDEKATVVKSGDEISIVPAIAGG